MEKRKKNFRDWDLDKIDEAFGTMQVRTLPALTEWLAYEYELDAYEKRYLSQLRENYFLGGDDWNEVVHDSYRDRKQTY